MGTQRVGYQTVVNPTPDTMAWFPDKSPSDVPPDIVIPCMVAVYSLVSAGAAAEEWDMNEDSPIRNVWPRGSSVPWLWSSIKLGTSRTPAGRHEHCCQRVSGGWEEETTHKTYNIGRVPISAALGTGQPTTARGCATP